MLIRDLPAALRRRWYLAIVGILLTIGLCGLAYVQFPPTYAAKASVVLLPPSTTVPEGGNPYLQLSDLKQAVDVMTRTLMSQETEERVMEQAPTGTFEVLPDYETSGPIIVITAGDVTPEAALKTLEVVKSMVSPALEDLQSTLGIAPESQITSKVLISDDQPSTVRKTQLRVLIIAFALGIAISALAVAIVDSALLRRAGRQAPKRTDSLETSGPGPRDDATQSGPTHPQDSPTMRPRRLGLNPSTQQPSRSSQETAGRSSR